MLKCSHIGMSIRNLLDPAFRDISKTCISGWSHVGMSILSFGNAENIAIVLENLAILH